MLKAFFFSNLLKSFKCGLASAAGRNFLGRICVHHQGGRKRKMFLKIDRYRYLNKFGFIFRILTHLFFKGFIGLIIYKNGLLNFILLSEGVQKGHKIFSGRQRVKAFLGYSQKLLNIKLFDPINSIEKFPLSGSKISRAAGVFSHLFSKANEKSVLKMSSG
jgi:ribosomal protein L2